VSRGDFANRAGTWDGQDHSRSWLSIQVQAAASNLTFQVTPQTGTTYSEDLCWHVYIPPGH